MVTENPFQYESCPECGMLSFMHDEDQKRHVCVNNECGYVVKEEGAHVKEGSSEKQSLWVKILKALRLKS